MARPLRAPAALLLGAPIVGVAVAAMVVAFAGDRAGRALDPQPAAAPAPEGTLGAIAVPSDGLPSDGGVGPASRVAPDGAILAAPGDDTYACLQPALEVAKDPGCAEGRGYPRCRWQLPSSLEAAGLYRVWRNTTPEHRWARPGLVSLVLTAAGEYAARWPGERITIGDLDAAGPRHQTHDRGVDVDLYIEHAMIARNIGGGRYPDNYEGRPEEEVRLLRARVMDLGRILATCSRGRLRIYYNDPEVVDAFRAWFDAQSLVSDVGPPMMLHNELHRFHFHMTVAEDLPPLSTE